MSIIQEKIIQVHPRPASLTSFETMYRIHVEYTEFDASKQTLVFLHGYLGSNEDYDPLKNRYSDQYNIIAMDLRGHGSSDNPLEIDWCISDFSFDVYQVITSIIEEGSKVKIIASSLATAIALEFTKNNPDLVDSLFLISPTYKFSKSNFIKLLLKIGKHTPDIIMLSIFEAFNYILPMFIHDEDEKQLLIEGFDKMRNIDIKTHRKILLETTDWKIDALDIPHKTLIIAGDSDTTVSYSDSKELNSLLPVSTMVTIENMKHLILRKKSDFIIDLLDVWLEQDYKLLRYKNHESESVLNLL